MATQRPRYLTKFSQLTLAVNKEPEDYIAEKVKLKWSSGRIYHDLEAIARKYKKDMVTKATILNWIERVSGGKEEDVMRE